MAKLFFSLRSKVSRRIFITVCLCALIPIGGLVIMTNYSVQKELSGNTERRLHSAGKNVGMALLAALYSLKTQLEREALLTAYRPAPENQSLQDPEIENVRPFLKTWFFTDRISASKELPRLSPEHMARLSNGLACLQIVRQEHGSAVFLWTRVVDENNFRSYAAAHINPNHLLEHALAFVPARAELLLTDENLQPLFRPEESSPSWAAAVAREEFSTDGRFLEIRTGDDAWLAGQWEVFLRAAYDSPAWYVFIAEPKKLAFAGLFDFQRHAGLMALFAFWVILLASSILIRHTLTPLEKMKQATQQISTGQYNIHIDVQGRDEFGLLSQSFNRMADKIQQQLEKQQALTLSVREVLGAGEQDEIIAGFFNGLARISTRCLAMLTLYKPQLLNNRKIGSTWLSKISSSVQLDMLWATELCPHEINKFAQSNDSSCHQTTANEFPTLLSPIKHFNYPHYCLFHLEINSQIKGVLVLAGQNRLSDREETTAVRQLADQLSLSLSRAEVAGELEALNIGILTALARTVDANSRWTHGHSERVTKYALIIAAELGRSEEDLQELKQAGLLHDLGKVSIPQEILNKPGKLTAEEYTLIQQHPGEADRILEPIHVFKSIRPLVRQHHERWDGAGYPDGLKGDEIHPGARILSVADVLDALYSDRPYREGWPRGRVLDYLKDEAGKAFDPKVVRAALNAEHKLFDQPDASLKRIAV